MGNGGGLSVNESSECFNFSVEEACPVVNVDFEFGVTLVHVVGQFFR